jgi:hypothetical protein
VENLNKLMPMKISDWVIHQQVSFFLNIFQESEGANFLA